jgi:hypothetical protein
MVARSLEEWKKHRFPSDIRSLLPHSQMPALHTRLGYNLETRVQGTKARAPQRGTCRLYSWTDRWLHRRNREPHHGHRNACGNGRLPKCLLESAARSHTSLLAPRRYARTSNMLGTNKFPPFRFGVRQFLHLEPSWGLASRSSTST